MTTPPRGSRGRDWTLSSRPASGSPVGRCREVAGHPDVVPPIAQVGIPLDAHIARAAHEGVLDHVTQGDVGHPGDPPGDGALVQDVRGELVSLVVGLVGEEGLEIRQGRHVRLDRFARFVERDPGEVLGTLAASGGPLIARDEAHRRVELLVVGIVPVDPVALVLGLDEPRENAGIAVLEGFGGGFGETVN